MGFLHADRVKETTTTTGTGTYSLAGAVTGFRTFVAGIGNTNRCIYCVEDGTNWEINEGVVASGTPDTITRARLLASSTGSAINWGAGTKNVFCAYSAADRNPRTRKLAAQVTNSTTTGVEVTGLELTSVQPGTYTFKYLLITQATVSTTGIKFGINFTGTAGKVVAHLRMVDTGTTATSGNADDAATASQIVGGFAARALSTTAPNLGPSVGVATINVDILFVLEGVIVVTAAGNLELWHGSEVAAQSSVEVGSSVVLTRIDD